MTEPIEQRVRYYNKAVDPALQPDGGYVIGETETPTEEHPANLVSSLCTDGYHRPAIDIDLPVEVIPSSTEGHFHLYFPTIKLTWVKYRALLRALVDAGIVEQGYLDHCDERTQTLLRLPGVKKNSAKRLL